MNNRTIDINCDMGEGMLNDAAIMPFISSANIACGAHAGDIKAMKETIALCLENNVAIGAHPSFDDRPNFGRTEMHLTELELHDLITNQLTQFSTIASKMNAIVHHVKPHGALYNMAARNPTMAHVVAQTVYDLNKSLVLYGLAGSHLISAGKKLGLKTTSEVFADRTYQPDGSLTSRSQPNALIHSEEDSLSQVLQMITQQKVTAVNGVLIPIEAQTICIHGDGKNAVIFAKKIYSSLNEKNISVRPV